MKHKTSYMIKLYTLFILTITAGLSFAQGDSFVYHNSRIELSPKLAEHFGDEYVQELKNKSVDILLNKNFRAEHGYSIVDIGEKANDEGVTLISKLTKFSKSQAPDFNGRASTFNILAYDIKFSEEQQVILTGNGTEAILLPTKENFLLEFNTYKSELLKQ
jgi:hypothetical protein